MAQNKRVSIFSDDGSKQVSFYIRYSLAENKRVPIFADDASKVEGSIIC